MAGNASWDRFLIQGGKYVCLTRGPRGGLLPTGLHRRRFDARGNGFPRRWVREGIHAPAGYHAAQSLGAAHADAKAVGMAPGEKVERCGRGVSGDRVRAAASDSAAPVGAGFSRFVHHGLRFGLRPPLHPWLQSCAPIGAKTRATANSRRAAPALKAWHTSV